MFRAQRAAPQHAVTDITYTCLDVAHACTHAHAGMNQDSMLHSCSTIAGNGSKKHKTSIEGMLSKVKMTGPVSL